MTVKTLLNIFSDDQLYAVLENVYEEIQRDFSCGQTVDHLRTLREIIEVINEKQSVPDLRLLNALKYIISDICTPILILEHVGKDEKLRNVVIDTKLFCLELTGEEENVVQWADECEKIVRKHFECVEEGSDPPEKCLKPEVALEIIKFLLKKIETDGKSDFNQFFLQFQSTLSLILSRCDSQFASSLLVDIVPMFFQVMDPENKVNFARVLWKRVESFFTFTYFDCQSRNTSNGYVIMCNLMELITDGDEKSIFASLCDQILSEKNFWLLIRFGLAHENSLHRKQSLYVLKLVTSRDRLESQHFSWSNYVLIIETLEETQVHVIKPVLGKIDQVIKASDVSTFYFDLMTTIFHRMFMHDSKFIKKWALERFLHLDLTREKFIDTQFVFIPFLNAINDASLFGRSQNELRGSVPAIVSSLSRFFAHCIDIFRGSSLIVDFFSCLLNSIRCLNWAPVPLLYVSYSLSTMPVAPAWNLSALEDLKSLVVDSLRTQEKYLKVSVHCFLFEAFFKLVKMDDVTFDILSSFLLPFAQYGAWGRQTNLRLQCIKWLQQPAVHLTSRNAVKFIKRMIQNVNDIETKDKDVYFTDLEMERTSRTLVLCLDAGFLALSDAEIALEPLKTILLSVSTRLYIPIVKIDRSLKFVISLLEEVENRWPETSQDQDTVRIEIITWIAPCVTAITDYALHRISNHDTNIEDVKRLEMYLKLMKCLFKAYHDSNALDQFVNKLVDVSLLHFNNNYADDNLPRKYCAVTCLAWITEIIENWDLEKWKSSRNKIMAFVTHQFANNVFNHTLTKSKKENTSAIYLGQRGRIISEYYNCVWTCLAFHTSRCANSLAVVPLIEFALYTLEIGTDVVPAVCRCIEPILAQILIENEERLLAKLLHCVWNMAFERRKSEIFWIAIESFMDLVFHQCLLDHSDASILIHFCEKAHALSDYCPTIFHMFVFRCLGVWIRSKSARRQICSHAQFIAHALTFGPVHRKDQRANGDADAFVFSLGETCSVNSLIQSEHLDQVSVRAAAVSLIISLDSGHPLVCELITLLLAEDARIGATRSRYYANSLIHLKKNRVWQAILVLEPLCAQETLTGVLNNVYSQLIEEGSQLSIRLMHEWLAVRILLRFSALRDQLWNEIEKAARIRVGSIGSFLGIIYHVGKLLDSAHQQQFILASFNCILPWCMAQNFNTRVTAQVSFHKLWLICEANSLQTALDLYAPVESSLRMSYRIGIGNSARCTQKILDNYYFKIFDAYKHYSLQTIFYDILRLTSVSDYEWIPSHVFTKFYNENTFLPIYNNDDELTEFEIDSIKDDEIEGETVENGNVQKKMTPCKRSADNNDSLSGELIVVASLIDKIPNLGGLCRSCEIFGAKEYVIGNMKCVQDKQFQNLSVSAEKWVSMSEVKAFQLKEYLTSKKRQGYVLIGAEQTANSVRVNDYQFPKKCVLLLGNEKEGIPVSLIQLLDVCVEIPQQGVVRSLNVHVCGALLIWEYSRQNFNINNK